MIVIIGGKEDELANLRTPFQLWSMRVAALCKYIGFDAGWLMLFRKNKLYQNKIVWKHRMVLIVAFRKQKQFC